MEILEQHKTWKKSSMHVELYLLDSTSIIYSIYIVLIIISTIFYDYQNISNPDIMLVPKTSHTTW